MAQVANIRVDPDTRDRLRAAKQGGESYDETINRLLEEAGEPPRRPTGPAGDPP
jgi:predicted CopG family antitoxin